MDTLLPSLDELPEQFFTHLSSNSRIRPPGNIFADSSSDHSIDVRTNLGLNASELFLGQLSSSHKHGITGLVL